MRFQRILRRVALGAALAGAAFGAVPALASAASTCTLDEATHRATVIDGGAVAPLRIARSGKFIVVQDGSGPMVGCAGTTTFATNTNTDRVIVQGTAGSSSSDGYIIDHSHGALAPGATLETDGNSEIEVQVRQLNGLPAQLTHIATAGPDTIRVAAGNDIAVGTDDDIGMDRTRRGGRAPGAACDIEATKGESSPRRPVEPLHHAMTVLDVCSPLRTASIAPQHKCPAPFRGHRAGRSKSAGSCASRHQTCCERR